MKKNRMFFVLAVVAVLIGVLFCGQALAEESDQTQVDNTGDANTEMTVPEGESNLGESTDEQTTNTTTASEEGDADISESVNTSTEGQSQDTSIDTQNNTDTSLTNNSISDTLAGTDTLMTSDSGNTAGKSSDSEEESIEQTDLENALQESISTNGLVDPKILFIGSTASFQAVNTAAHSIMNEINPSAEAQQATGKVYDPNDQSTWLITFRILDGSSQLAELTTNEFIDLIKSSDIIICTTEYNSVNEAFEKAIAQDPTVLDRPILILLQSTPNLVKLSRINGDLQFDGVPDSVIGTSSTTNSILGAVKNQNVSGLEAYKTAYPQAGDWLDIALYTASKGSVNYENLFKFVLKKFTEGNGGTWPTKWDPAAYFTYPADVLYRDGKVYTTLEDYFAAHPYDPSKPTIGVIEYDSPLFAGNMDHFEDMIDSLAAKGMNVIPTVAQWTGYYRTMVKFFTGAPTTADYENNPENYPTMVDGIVVFKTFALFYDTDVEKGMQLLENMNVPIFRAVSTSSRTVGEWLTSDDGILWSQSYYQIAMLEKFGLIEPIIVATHESWIDDVTGALLKKYTSIPERMEKFTERIKNWTDLKYMENPAKKIALIYYNYPPGKQNIGASYLNVPGTILQLFQRLKEEGYIVDDIPQTEDELIALMMERGINVANWAPGVLEEMANNPQTILWDAGEYLAWFESLGPIARKQVIEGPVGYIEELIRLGLQYVGTDETAKEATLETLDKWTKEMISLVETYPEKSQQATTLINSIYEALKEVVNNTINNIDTSTAWNNFYNAKNAFIALGLSGLCGWGEAPGNIMTVTRDGKEYIVIPGMVFGNAFIGPEPQRGWEADADKFYHSTIVPPHHQYLAWYAYVNNVFKADAQVHLGRHATYEWLPGKQVTLASFDYSDIIVGDTPSIYIYIVDGVGEGLQAKRRGLAVIIDHLTPALKMTSMNYGGFTELKGLVDDYEKTPDGNPMKEEYKNAIIAKIIELNLTTDLGIEDASNITDENVDKLHEYLLDLQQTLMPYGLHTFGLEWTYEEIALLATAMVSADGGIDSPSLQRLLAQENGWDFDNLTLAQAEQLNNQAQEWILQLFTGQKTVDELTSNAQLQSKLNQAINYTADINASFEAELSGLIDALNGGFITPSTGNDPIRNPDAVPTGSNFYGMDDSQLPTKVAWDLGKRLADMALAQFDVLPEKIAAVVWCVETSRDDGTMASFVLRMLGVEPTWYSSGSVNKFKATSLAMLLNDLNAARAVKGFAPLTERPRIDVVMTTSGLFRDLFPKLLVNMDRSYRIALAASYNTIVTNYPSLKDALDYALQTLESAKYTGYKGSDPIERNYIARHWIEMTLDYISQGLSVNEAAEYAITRIFAPPVGEYGTGVNKAVEQSWTWEDREQVADVYLNRMSHAYSERNWGVSAPDLFEGLLNGIETAYHSRSTNLYGVLDNDDYYDYFGGLSMAIEKVNGKAPDLNVLYYANTSAPQVTSLLTFMAKEMRTRYYNPEWIQGMMNEGYSGARSISNKFVSYLWGWQVTNPDVVKNWMWDEVVNTYIKDQYNLGVTGWLSSGNRAYAMISVTGTLLTAAQKGYWQADEATLREVANTWARLTAQYGPACCDCSCGNLTMMRWATSYIDSNLLMAVQQAILSATGESVLTPEQLDALLKKLEKGEAESATGSATANNAASDDTQSPSSASNLSKAIGDSNQSTDAAAPISVGDNTIETESPLNSPGTDSKRSYELKKEGQESPAISKSWVSIAPILGVLLIVALGIMGYFKNGIIAFIRTIGRKEDN